MDSEIPIAVYAAMLAGTLGGQLLGVLIATLSGSGTTRGFLLPFGCSVLLEAFIGQRYAAARMEREPTRRELGQISVYYSLVLVGVCAPLYLWFRMAAGSFSRKDVVVGALALPVLAVYTAVRFGLMTLLSRRPT